VPIESAYPGFGELVVSFLSVRLHYLDRISEIFILYSVSF
jgi:hypothetical protein